jgi:hypothetical protein
MRFILSAAAFAAAFAVTAANAQTYVPAGPVKQGTMCTYHTNGDQTLGYVGPCPAQPAAMKKKKK